MSISNLFNLIELSEKDPNEFKNLILNNSKNRNGELIFWALNLKNIILLNK